MLTIKNFVKIIWKIEEKEKEFVRLQEQNDLLIASQETGDEKIKNLKEKLKISKNSLESIVIDFAAEEESFIEQIEKKEEEYQKKLKEERIKNESLKNYIASLEERWADYEQSLQEEQTELVDSPTEEEISYYFPSNELPSNEVYPLRERGYSVSSAKSVRKRESGMFFAHFKEREAWFKEREALVEERDARPAITEQIWTDTQARINNLISEKTALTEARDTLTNEKAALEQRIVQQLISDLELGMSENINLEQVIKTLKILLDKVPIESLKTKLTEANNIVENLRQQLNAKEKTSGNYVLLEQELTQAKLTNKELITKQQTERVTLLVLLMTSLVTIGVLIARLRTKKRTANIKG